MTIADSTDDEQLVRVDVFFGDELESVRILKIPRGLLKGLQDFSGTGSCDASLLESLGRFLPEALPGCRHTLEELTRELRINLCGSYAMHAGSAVELAGTFSYQMK
jgi:hypothetical protein